MLDLLDPLRQLSLLSVSLRLILAVLCGGLIGLEREYKRRPAGFRTHILICLGAAITTMTSQYLSVHLHFDTDVTRLGAQVVAGVGFIGAGTIIVTRRQRVKGLTTAAGLWAVAIVGIAIGMGFFEIAAAATLLMLLAELLFVRLEYRIFRSSPEVNLYVEYEDRDSLDQVLKIFREKEIKVLHLEITRSRGDQKHNASVIFSLRLNKQLPIDRLTALLQQHEGVLSVEEL